MLLYGKLHTTESVQNGTVTKRIQEYEESVLVGDKAALIQELLEAVKLVNDGTAQRVVLTMVGDEDNQVRKIVKRYTTSKELV